MNDLSLHLLDIVQNSISAGATLIEIDVDEQIADDLLAISIADNGKGMTPEQVEKVTDPFFTSRTTRKVGMGIPLFKQSAEQSGGKLTITSTVGVGTRVEATFQYNHIDRPALGDIPNAVCLLVMSNPVIDFLYKHSVNDDSYIFDTREVKEALGGISINDLKVVPLINEMIEENVKNLRQ